MKENTQAEKNNPIPDYEVLFQESAGEPGKRGGGKILKHLFYKNRFQVLWSSVLYIIKASPTYAIPLVTTNVINAVTSNKPDMMRTLMLNGIVLLILYAAFCAIQFTM